MLSVHRVSLVIDPGKTGYTPRARRFNDAATSHDRVAGRDVMIVATRRAFTSSPPSVSYWRHVSAAFVHLNGVRPHSFRRSDDVQTLKSYFRKVIIRPTRKTWRFRFWIRPQRCLASVLKCISVLTCYSVQEQRRVSLENDQRLQLYLGLYIF